MKLSTDMKRIPTYWMPMPAPPIPTFKLTFEYLKRLNKHLSDEEIEHLAGKPKEE